MASAVKTFSLDGKTSLITGGAGMLGFAHAKALLDINANVILADINKLELERTKLALSDLFPGRTISAVIMDVTSEADVNRVSQDFENQELRVDILVNNAAINPTSNSLVGAVHTSRLENFSLERWNNEIAVGLTGAFLCSKVFGTKMAVDGLGGVILNIASDLSVIAPDQSLYRQDGVADAVQPVKPVTYPVTKTALLGLTRYLASYWADKGVRANAISPGGVYVDQDQEFIQRIQKLIPMGRMANKDEYIGAIQFLCSDASAYMNGHNLVMDGGRSII